MALLALTSGPLQQIDTGDTAWVLAASALVLLMAPGPALFYVGMVRSKTVLNMMMMTIGALAAITIIWVLVGYSIAFGDDLGGGPVGDPLQHFGLQTLPSESADTWLTVPVILFAMFQGLGPDRLAGAPGDGLPHRRGARGHGIDLIIHAETAYDDLHSTAGAARAVPRQHPRPPAGRSPRRAHD
jgi:hypothetical protein